MGHGEIGDPAGNFVLRKHDEGDHRFCHQRSECQL
jgi:hypothetical protein